MNFGRWLTLLAALHLSLIEPVALAQDNGDEDLDSTGSLFRSSDPVLDRSELHRWERFVRRFRRDHNFSLALGVGSASWQVEKFGTIQGRRYDNTSLFSLMRFAYHVQLVRGFGYFLGSTVGYNYETADSRRPFRPTSAIRFPGVLGGLVMNFTPSLRAGVGGDIYLERHDGVQERDRIDPDPEISFNMQVFELHAFFDIFYSINWALRISGGGRYMQFFKPRESKGLDIDGNIKKSDQFLGLGFVFHLI